MRQPFDKYTQMTMFKRDISYSDLCNHDKPNRRQPVMIDIDKAQFVFNLEQISPGLAHYQRKALLRPMKDGCKWDLNPAQHTQTKRPLSTLDK